MVTRSENSDLGEDRNGQVGLHGRSRTVDQRT